MSWFRFTGALRRGGNSNGLSCREYFPAAKRVPAVSFARQGCDERGSRLLRIDPLENRCLLSLSPRI